MKHQHQLHPHGPSCKQDRNITSLSSRSSGSSCLMVSYIFPAFPTNSKLKTLAPPGKRDKAPEPFSQSVLTLGTNNSLGPYFLVKSQQFNQFRARDRGLLCGGESEGSCLEEVPDKK